jgi:hypothetical protein
VFAYNPVGVAGPAGAAAVLIVTELSWSRKVTINISCKYSDSMMFEGESPCIISNCSSTFVN